MLVFLSVRVFFVFFSVTGSSMTVFSVCGFNANVFSVNV